MVQASVEVLRHVLQEAKDILDVQAESLASLRASASTLLGFDGVILGLGLAGFTFFRGEVGLLVDVGPLTGVFATGTFVILASTFLATWCLLPKPWIGGLPATQLVEVMDYNIGEPEFIAQAVRAYERFIKTNAPILEDTALAQSWAARGLVGGVALYTVTAGALIYVGA